MSNPSLETIFESIFGNRDFIPFNKNFLKEKIKYYKETNQERPDLYLDVLIYDNYDMFEAWCNKTNKHYPYPDMEFVVKRS
jgi:hypothetical protein